jgi:hypothetical protein
MRVIIESYTRNNLHAVGQHIAGHKALGHVDRRTGFVIFSLASECHITSVANKSWFQLFFWIPGQITILKSGKSHYNDQS